MSAQLQNLRLSSKTSPTFYSSSPTFDTTTTTTMPATRRRRQQRRQRRQTTMRKRKTVKGIKRSKAVIRKGRVHVKLSKNRTVALAPSQLIKYMPLNKMKRAAQSIIRQSTVKVKRRRQK